MVDKGMQEKEHGERFLLAIPTLCRATKQRGEDTLEPETCKVVLLQKIMGLMETVALDEDPRRTLCYSMAAICSLSKLKPALEPAMESCLLQTTLKICLTSPRHNSLYVREEEIPARIMRKLLVMKGFKQLPRELQGHSLLASSSSTPCPLQQPKFPSAASTSSEADSTSLSKCTIQSLTGSKTAPEGTSSPESATTLGSSTDVNTP
ncbi:hypothetical protein Y1Q_0009065 [Alligator mississippiensis]|uniref:Uncharacterized protein n=1 Tax=Alligator mississippiensis TaxID=8496 RepID=A0A151N3G1_ALLMI|nr:hypothetical protein Y1Q_0009065 [Alligator mississippiensis]